MSITLKFSTQCKLLCRPEDNPQQPDNISLFNMYVYVDTWTLCVHYQT